MRRDPGVLRKDRDAVFTKFTDGLYRAVLDGEPWFIQRDPLPPSEIAHNPGWFLVSHGEVMEYDTKAEAMSDAALFTMAAEMRARRIA